MPSLFHAKNSSRASNLAWSEFRVFVCVRSGSSRSRVVIAVPLTVTLLTLTPESSAPETKLHTLIFHAIRANHPRERQITHALLAIIDLEPLVLCGSHVSSGEDELKGYEYNAAFWLGMHCVGHECFFVAWPASRE